MTAAELKAIMQKYAPDAVPDGLEIGNGDWWLDNTTDPIASVHAEHLCIAELVARLVPHGLDMKTYPSTKSVVTCPCGCGERSFQGDTLLEALAKAYAAVKEMK